MPVGSFWIADLCPRPPSTRCPPCSVGDGLRTRMLGTRRLSAVGELVSARSGASIAPRILAIDLMAQRAGRRFKCARRNRALAHATLRCQRESPRREVRGAGQRPKRARRVYRLQRPCAVRRVRIAGSLGHHLPHHHHQSAYSGVPWVKACSAMLRIREAAGSKTVFQDGWSALSGCNWPNFTAQCKFCRSRQRVSTTLLAVLWIVRPPFPKMISERLPVV